MEIYVNGEITEVADTSTAATLLNGLGLSGKRVAMEVNCEIVPRSGYATCRIEPGDRVEIVAAIGGG
jgi:sulfur carrier protein